MMNVSIFDSPATRARLEALGTAERIAFAAFWAQRLWPVYQRLHVLDGFGQPDQVQECLDLAWAAARGDLVDAPTLEACKGRLPDLAPEIDLRPVLAYASMECVAAVWDTLEVIQDPTAELSAATCDAFGGVIEHYLMNRDHPYAVIASREPDPLGMQHDPISETNVVVWVRLLDELGAMPVGVPGRVDFMKRWAMDTNAQSFADALTTLSLRLKPTA